MLVARLILVLLGLASLFYLVYAIRSVVSFARRRVPEVREEPPVTVLKPVCGLEPELYENLRSFCEQDYPRYQVVFGVADAADPAIPVIERLLRELPERDLQLEVSNRLIGSNRKISNLANAYALAHHDLLVIADSDMRVGPDYLHAVVSQFQDSDVGAATCLYSGTPAGGLPSILGTVFINEWFLPSVLVALGFQDLRFCFGATMAVRRHVLERIGGLPRLAAVLADDYMLGKLVSDAGYKVRLVPYVVRNVVLEPDLRSLFMHELRWARTVRSVQPLGYAFSFITHAIPTTLICLALWPSAATALIAALAVVLRLVMHAAARRSLALDGPARPWLVPLRDVLCFAVWGASFLGRDVQWRHHQFSIQDNGHLALKESRTP